MKTVVLDTNIFIRLLVKDDVEQYKEAALALKKIEDEKQKGLVSVLVINEVIWVLENNYETKRKDFIPQFLTLLLLKNMEIIETSKNTIITILRSMQNTDIDFTDYYLNSIKGENTVLSFDKDFKKF